MDELRATLKANPLIEKVFIANDETWYFSKPLNKSFSEFTREEILEGKAGVSFEEINENVDPTTKQTPLVDVKEEKQKKK